MAALPLAGGRRPLRIGEGRVDVLTGVDPVVQPPLSFPTFLPPSQSASPLGGRAMVPKLGGKERVVVVMVVRQGHTTVEVRSVRAPFEPLTVWFGCFPLAGGSDPRRSRRGVGRGR